MQMMIMNNAKENESGGENESKKWRENNSEGSEVRMKEMKREMQARRFVGQKETKRMPKKVMVWSHEAMEKVSGYSIQTMILMCDYLCAL